MSSHPFNPIGAGTPAFPIVVSGPSGVGKTVLVRKLLELDPTLASSVSATSRPRRKTEEDGVHYHFLDRNRFETLMSEGGLLEWARVHEHYYGTPRRPLEEQLRAGRSVVLNIDVQGARQIRAARPDAVLIFIVPPSLKTLEDRLRSRGTDSEAVIQLRLQNAVGELDQAVHYDYVVVNDNVELAGERLRAIVEAERHRLARLHPERDKV
jgi:guanylate kinase